MKPISKIIKGLILALLFSGAISLNVESIALHQLTHESVNAKSSLGKWFGSQALAQQSLDTDGFDADAAALGEATAARQSDAAPDTSMESIMADDSPGESSIDYNKILETVAKASTYVNNIFNPLIHFLTFGIGAFLGNDYIFAGAMGTMLHTIWVISRNIVNIVFVLILLFMALKHIFRQDDTDIAKTLPKFVIMLIAVNFSWLAGKLILDAGNVATNVVFAIPAGIQGIAGETIDTMINTNPCSVPGNEVKGSCSASKVYWPGDRNKTYNVSEATCTPDFMKQIEKEYAKAYPKGGKPDPNTFLAKKAIICWQQIKPSDYNQNNASYYLTYSMARVQNLTRANTKDEIGQLAIGTMFSMIMQIVYLAAFGSLYIALIARVAMLWILMAFSPFIVLLMFAKEIGLGGGMADEYLSIPAFAEWAFVPAKVGAVWTIGFIMITAGQSMGKDVFATLNADGTLKANIFSANSLFLGMDTFQQFIWLLMTTGIIWMGTFAVLGKLKVVGSTLAKIGSAGEHFVGELGHLGMQVPIIPTGHGHGEHGHMSLSKLNPNKMLRGYANTLEGGDAGKLTAARENLKANVSTMVSMQFTDEKAVMEKFRSVTGMSQSDIVNNISEVQEMVRQQGGGLGDEKQKLLIEIIGKQTKSGPSNPAITVPAQPATAVVPPATGGVSPGVMAAGAPENTSER